MQLQNNVVPLPFHSGKTSFAQDIVPTTDTITPTLRAAQSQLTTKLQAKEQQ